MSIVVKQTGDAVVDARYEISEISEIAFDKWQDVIKFHGPMISQVYCELKVDHMLYIDRYNIESSSNKTEALNEIFQKTFAGRPKKFSESASFKCQDLFFENKGVGYVSVEETYVLREHFSTNQWVRVLDIFDFFTQHHYATSYNSIGFEANRWCDSAWLLPGASATSSPEVTTSSGIGVVTYRLCDSAWPLPGASATSFPEGCSQNTFMEQMPLIALTAYYIGKLFRAK